MSHNKPPIRFRGYASPHYTMVPDELFDEQLPHLSGAEVKALLYIMRRTFGFKKPSDDISLSQICHGITTRDGRVLDRGTGLSRSTAQVAIKGLVEKNLIKADRRYSDERGFEATTYTLNLCGGPYAENRSSPPPKIDLALDRKSVIQETVAQDTDQQETEINSNEINSNVYVSNRSNAELSTTLRAQSTVDNPREDDLAEVSPRPLARTDRPSSVGQILDRAVPLRPAPAGSAYTPGRGRPPNAPDQLAAAMQEASEKLNDEQPRSSLTRATKLWRESGLPVDKFCQRVYQAMAESRQAKAKKRSAYGDGVLNRTPLFFAELERALGFRDPHDWSVRHVPPGL